MIYRLKLEEINIYLRVLHLFISSYKHKMDKEIL